MDIVFGGHLDRAFLLGSKPNFFGNGVFDPSFPLGVDDVYQSLFQAAGTLAALSESVVKPDDLPSRQGEALTRCDAKGAVYEAVGLAQLEQDALRFAQVFMRIRGLSDCGLAYAQIRAKNDPHESNAVHHIEGLMFAVLHCWNADATLAISDGDRSILSEIATGVVEDGIALPFMIPDLRGLMLSSSPSAGTLPNFEPSDLGDVGNLRVDPVVQLYRQRIEQLPSTQHNKVGSLLQDAFAESRKKSSFIRRLAKDVSIISVRAKSLDNENVTHIKHDPFGWSPSQSSRRKMHIVILSAGRSLN